MVYLCDFAVACTEMYIGENQRFAFEFLRHKFVNLGMALG
jgi:hypothetical protein